MITKAVIFDGKPGSGPEPEPDPEPFVSTICSCPMGLTGSRKDCYVHGTEAFGDDRTTNAAPVKRGPGRPRKSPASRA